MLSILFLAAVAVMVVCSNYSAWRRKCVVATAVEKLHGSQRYWSKPVSLPSYVCAPVRFVCAKACFSHFCSFVPLVNVCLQARVAQVRAGKDAVYEIGIIYLGCGGGWWRVPRAPRAGNIEMQEKSLWSVVKWSTLFRTRGTFLSGFALLRLTCCMTRTKPRTQISSFSKICWVFFKLDVGSCRIYWLNWI